MKTETTQKCKLLRCMKAPVRALRRARDLYVKSLTDCSGRMHYSAAMGYPAGVVYTLPESFTVNSSKSDYDEDLRNLIQAVSRRSPAEPASKFKGLPKSFSVVIGRIDEDKPSYFEEDLKVNSNEVLCPRNTSYAASNKRNLVIF